MIAAGNGNMNRIGIAAAAAALMWAVSIYPIAFAYASREAVSGPQHNISLASAVMAAYASGWFSIILLVSAVVATISLWSLKETGAWRRCGWAVLMTSASLLVVHLVCDGPTVIARNVWITLLHPSSFRMALVYFELAVRNWNSWP